MTKRTYEGASEMFGGVHFFINAARAHLVILADNEPDQAARAHIGNIDTELAKAHKAVTAACWSLIQKGKRENQ